jgi:PKD domain/FlgD Ig-like domain/Putative Ig domain
LAKEMTMRPFLLLVLWLAAFVVSAPDVRAQYMYLDTNGDGVHSTADDLLANGVPTTVDIWLWTNQNRDGSPAICNTQDGSLTINSYSVNLEALDGTVTYSGFINRQPLFVVSHGELNPNGIHYKNGFGIGPPTTLPPGLYRLATLTITGITGTPSIRILDRIPSSGDFTSFGTQCSGNDFDNTYKLAGPSGGSDWFDADGTDTEELTNTPPVLAPIGPQSGAVGVPLTFTATATDVDVPAQTLTFSLGIGSPAGATIHPSSGFFSWTPSAAGVFAVTVFVREDGTPPMSDGETIQATISQVDDPPQLLPIGNQTVNEQRDLAIQVHATDPAQNSLTYSLGPGAPTGATIHPTSGLFEWRPTEAQGPGVYPMTITVSSSANGRSDSETIQVTVNELNFAPEVNEPSDMTVTEGATATQQLTAFDPDIPVQTLTFSKDANTPPFVFLSATTGLLTISPGLTDSGVYSIGVSVSDGVQGPQFTSKFFDLTVVPAAPTADAGGPYEGIVGVPVFFDGTGSSDPEGNPLAFLWNFGDGSQGSGSTPAHTYLGAAVYNVTLTVTSDGVSDNDATTATIAPDLELLAFTTGGNKRLRLGSGKQQACIQLEPVGGAFEVADLAPGSIRMTYGGGSIGIITGKTVLGSDKNQNGVDEITACFSKDDLRTLFADLPNGEQTVHVTIEAIHVSGATAQGPLALRVFQSGGGGSSLTIAPNPLNPSATATFLTSRTGSVRVSLYDLHGRLVRTLMDEPLVAAGYHDVTIDGQDMNGSRLASGIYYVKVRSSADGEMTKAVTILK